MTKKTKIVVATILFFIVSVADTFAVVFQNKTMEIVFKPLLMISLLVVYFFSIKKVNWWLVLGLLFAFLGDVLLLADQSYFVFGVASFLVTHVLYIKIIVGFLEKKSFTRMVLSIVPYMTYFLTIMYVVFDNLKDMLIPVAEYGLVVSIYGAVTFLNYQQEKSKGNLLLFFSAMFFVIADGFIILNIYYEYNKILDFFVILLYITAQYLTVKGLIVREETNKI